MIFVTVGTHEQPFNRLVEAIDAIKGDSAGPIPQSEQVFVQTGFSTYMPQHCKWSKLLSHEDMQKYMRDARIIITHGGPSSFLAPLQLGKVPIVMPRRADLNEHVNNHQVNFVQTVADKFSNIIVVDSQEELTDAIRNYDELSQSMRNSTVNNNAAFCKKLSGVVSDLFGGAGA